MTAADGQLVLGTGRGGRGAWVCATDPIACLDAAGDGRLNRALRQRLTSASITAVGQALQ